LPPPYWNSDGHACGIDGLAVLDDRSVILDGNSLYPSSEHELKYEENIDEADEFGKNVERRYPTRSGFDRQAIVDLPSQASGIGPARAPDTAREAYEVLHQAKSTLQEAQQDVDRLERVLCQARVIVEAAQRHNKLMVK
jgi:hypothetical protein